MGRATRNPSNTTNHKITMTDYRRYRINGGTYFFTVNLADRNRALLTEHIDTLRESFRVVKEAHPFEIDA
jgi:putative transposase